MASETGSKTAIRYSKKRSAILDLIKGTSTHPSAEWLFAQLKPEYPDLSLGTIYRNLTFFQEQGDIISVGVIGGQERFDATTHPHCHFVCEKCNSVLDLHEIQWNGAMEHQVSNLYGFSVNRVETTMYGQCDACLHEELSKK